MRGGAADLPVRITDSTSQSRNDASHIVGIDLGTSRTSIAASNGVRETVYSFVGYPKDVVARKLLKKDVLFGKDAVEQRLSLPEADELVALERAGGHVGGPEQVGVPAEPRAGASARGPGQRAAGEEVHMQMRHRFAGVRPVVHDQAEAGGQVKFFCQRAGDEEQMAQHGLVGGAGGGAAVGLR